MINFVRKSQILNNYMTIRIVSNELEKKEFSYGRVTEWS